MKDNKVIYGLILVLGTILRLNLYEWALLIFVSGILYSGYSKNRVMGYLYIIIAGMLEMYMKFNS